MYLLETADATPCDILVREKGHAPNVMMLFETACEQYDYLNGVVGYGLAKQIPGGVSVQVFSVSDLFLFVQILFGLTYFVSTGRHLCPLGKGWLVWL